MRGSLRKLLALGAALALLLPAAAGCALVQFPDREQMRVQVTGAKYFGSQVLFDRQVTTGSGATAADALGEAADVDLSGDYVASVDGISGDQKVYWFYYINGMLSKVFADGYQLHPGDQEFWDWHDWTFYSMGPSAYLGAFPEPCLHGYGGVVAPTVVVCSPEFRHEAGLLQERLTALGVAGVTVKEADALTMDERQQDNIFIIATADQPLIADLKTQLQASGALYFSGGRVVARDLTGRDAQGFGAGYGVLDVMQDPWNPRGTWACQNAVWAVTGLDAAGVRRAARVLFEFPASLSHSFALIVGRGEAIKCPLGQSGAPVLAVNTETDPAPAVIGQGRPDLTGPGAQADRSGAAESHRTATAAWLARCWWMLVLAALAAIIAGRLIGWRRHRQEEESAEEQELL